MPYHILCPGCGRLLRVPDGHVGPSLACQHCLTETLLPLAPGARTPTNGDYPRPVLVPPNRRTGSEMRLPLSFVGVLLFTWVSALCLAALSGGGKHLGFLIFAAAITCLADFLALIWLAIWFFPRASRKLESPVLGFFVGLPIFALLAAAVVIFFWATCYGVAVLL